MDLSSYSPAVSGPDTASLDKAAARRAAGEAYSDKFAQDEKSGVNMKCHNTTTHQVISRRQRLSEGDFQLATLPAYRHSICFQLVPAEFSGTDKLLPTPSQVTLMLGSPPSPRPGLGEKRKGAHQERYSTCHAPSEPSIAPIWRLFLPRPKLPAPQRLCCWPECSAAQRPVR